MRDQFANPVTAVQTVSFSVTAREGSIASATAPTGSNGSVNAPAWRLGKSAVLQTLHVSLASIPALDISAIVATAYKIDVRFFGPTMTALQQALFINAAHRLEGIVTGDVLDAQAGPCLYRNVAAAGQPAKYMPAAGVMQFDAADINTLAGSGSLQEVIMHEMLHVLGVGVLWEDRGQLSGKGTTDPRHTGALTRQGCVAVSGTVTCAISVPVEATGSETWATP